MIGERIKKLRKTLDLTQQEFSERIGIKRNTIAKYETTRGEPIDAVISLICREFGVSETWLRTGEGEMFIKQEPKDELAAAVDRLITGESAEFKRRLVLALSSLKDEHWALLEQKLKEIIGHRETAAAPAPDSEAPPEPQQPVSENDRLLEIMAMNPADMTDAEYALYSKEFRRQAIEEKKAEENAKASQGATWRRKKA